MSILDYYSQTGSVEIFAVGESKKNFPNAFLGQLVQIKVGHVGHHLDVVGHRHHLDVVIVAIAVGLNRVLLVLDNLLSLMEKSRD